jgi:hypothetical protein
MMKKVAGLLGVALMGAGMLAATPSFAQVQFGVGPNGPTVRVGPEEDRYERRIERRIERRRYNDDRLSTGSVDRCRTVVIREEDDNGDVITRRVRRCR